jgi:hypothetical protein
MVRDVEREPVERVRELDTGAPSAVTRPAAMAAWALARLSNRPRATSSRSARWRTVMRLV